MWPTSIRLSSAPCARPRRDAADDGVEFVVDSGWRSPAYQEQLLREAVSKYGSEAEAARWVATPNTSAHVSGDAVDIGPSGAAAWLSEHGAAYGLCQIYGNEPWHYELRPEAIDHGCPPMYADPTHDPRMQQMTSKDTRVTLARRSAAASPLVAPDQRGLWLERTFRDRHRQQHRHRSAERRQKATDQDKAVKFAECIRAHGVPHFPDPDAKGDSTSGSIVSPAVWKKAVDACKDLQPPGALSGKRSPKQQSAALRFAECVREQRREGLPGPRQRRAPHRHDEDPVLQPARWHDHPQRRDAEVRRDL